MLKNQKGFHLTIVALVVIVLGVLGFTGWKVFHSSKTETPNRAVAKTSLVTANKDTSTLPSIQYFRDHPTDQFIVDYDVIGTGHPYLGKRAIAPHPGGHVNFEKAYETWPRGGTSPSNYPKIYAIADGEISSITTKLAVGSNDRYGIYLRFAKDGDINWDFEYSIEPFVPEPSPGFYLPFILVHNGQHVKKGDVIAYMYTPRGAGGTHIHFEVINAKTNEFKAPAIFTPTVVQNFYDHWNGQGYDGASPTNPGVKIPMCMGYMLDASENPFGTGASDCLN